MHSDFDSEERNSSFFCMKLAGFILRDNRFYRIEMHKAKKGKCSYKYNCSIYAKTAKNKQLKLDL